jgi:hypothetical protein
MFIHASFRDFDMKAPALETSFVIVRQGGYHVQKNTFSIFFDTFITLAIFLLPHERSRPSSAIIVETPEAL